jgi:hypothetical protein
VLLFYTHYPLSTLCRISDQYGWPLLKELDTVLFVCVQRSFSPDQEGVGFSLLTL